MCQFNGHKITSSISTWNKEIILRANTNQSGVMHRIIIRACLASLWLENICINNLMTFQIIMVRTPNCQQGNQKPLSKSNYENFQFFLRRRKGQQEARDMGGTQALFQLDPLFAFPPYKENETNICKEMNQTLYTRGNMGTGSYFTSSSHIEAYRDTRIQVSLERFKQKRSAVKDIGPFG